MTKKKEIKKTSKELDAEINRKLGAMSYLWILCLIPLLSGKDSDFIKFHSKQGLILFILSFAGIVPFFGQIFILVLMVVSSIGFLKAYNQEWYEIPIIYEWSKKIKL